MRYHRQISLNGFDLAKQEKLFASRVVIIGAGGLGCSVAQYLCAAGVGHISIIDQDSVELTNLQRQVLHTEADIGSSKVSSAVSALAQINSECELLALEQHLNGENANRLLENYDLIVDCTDNIDARNVINKAAYSLACDLVSGAAIRMEGQVFCVSPSHNSACYQCISAYFDNPQLSCSEAGIMSPIVGIVGALQALEGIKMLSDYGTVALNSLMFFDGMHSEWHRFKVNKRPACDVCSRHPALVVGSVK